MPGPSRPRSPQEWAEHAVTLHREGLAALDSLVGTDMPTDVALAHVAHAAAYFHAAGSAASIGALTERLGRR